MTPTALLILSIVQGAVRAAPDVARVISDAKVFIDSLVKAGAIPVGQQDTLNSYLDKLADDVDAGIWPEHWTVQPDPQ